MDMSQLKTVRLDTNVTPNQGGTYSSASIQRGGPQVRTAAAEARQALLQTGIEEAWRAAGCVSRCRRELFLSRAQAARSATANWWATNRSIWHSPVPLR